MELRLQGKLGLEQIGGLLAIQRQLALLLAGEDAGHLLGVEALCSSWVMVAASARALALTFCHASLLQGGAAGVDGELLGSAGLNTG